MNRPGVIENEKLAREIMENSDGPQPTNDSAVALYEWEDWALYLCERHYLIFPPHGLYDHVFEGELSRPSGK